MNIDIGNLKKFLEPENRAYLCGVAMASRFVTALFPIPSVFIFLLMAAPLGLSWALYGIPRVDLHRIPWVIWIILILALIHIAGLWVGPTLFWHSVLRDLVSVGVLSVLFLFGMQGSVNLTFKLHKGFFDALIPVAVCMAALGLIKVVAVALGIVDPYYLVAHTSINPRGSSFASDHNLVGLTFIAAAIGVILRHCRWLTRREVLGYVVLPLVILCSACIVTSSRRALLAMPFLALLWVVIGMGGHSIRMMGRRVVLPMALVISATALLSWQMSVITNRARSEQPLVAKFLYANAPSRTLSTVYSGQFVDARSQRWALGADLLKQTKGVGATGFTYHNAFACKFEQCRRLDYPHLFLLSEWLIGGVPAVLLSLAFYFLLFRSVVRNGWRGVEVGSSVLFLAILPFSFVSGDTLFSVPQLFASGFLVCGTSYLVSDKHAARGQSHIF